MGDSSFIYTSLFFINKRPNYPHDVRMHAMVSYCETRGNVGNYKFSANSWRERRPFQTVGNPELWKPLEAGLGTWISTTKPNIYFVLQVLFLPSIHTRFASAPKAGESMCHKPTEFFFFCYPVFSVTLFFFFF